MPLTVRRQTSMKVGVEKSGAGWTAYATIESAARFDEGQNRGIWCRLDSLRHAVAVA
jgi:hypothetical protein